MEEISAIMNRSSELCFNREDFMADDFSVDKFVSQYRRHTSLESIKEDLGLFLKVLHTAMVELINRDYTDFVNLSTNLVGLDKSIKNLSSPLKDVQSRVKNVLTKLEGTLSSLQDSMQKRESIHQKKILLNKVIFVLEGIENIEKQKNSTSNTETLEIEVLERIAVEYSRIQFHMSQGESVGILKENESTIREIESLLLHNLDNIFINSLSNNDFPHLYRALRVYSSIEKVKDVEDKFRTAIVRPYMRQIIDEKFLRKEGIDIMYERVLKFILEKCNLLLSITRGGKKDNEVLKEYDFLINAVFPEIVICLEYIAPILFDPGNPSHFHKNYTSSMKFLDNFEMNCQVQTSVKRLRNHQSYKSFIDRWNLDIYFEIRFQEIAGFFEASLMSPFNSDENKENLFLYSSAVLLQSLKRCWEPDVYMKPLDYKFFKLSLQLLSRYSNWVITVTKIDKGEKRLQKESSQVIKDEIQTIKLVMLVHDIQKLSLAIEDLFLKQIYQNLKMLSDSTRRDVLDDCIRTYQSLIPKVGNVIVSRLTSKCTQHLKLITDIPRLYRKTNREVPTKPSGYVSMVLSPLSAFVSETELLDVSKCREQWLIEVIDSIIEQCLMMTSDVLTSIKKMEDSLKRLKKAREKSSGQNISGTTSDDDKIRQQLVLDVEFLGAQISKYGYDKTSGKYKKLEDLVLSAVKTGSAL